MIEARNLTCGYSQPVLKEVCLQIRPGIFQIWIGLNGSGKSTLMKTLLGLIPSLSGDILLEEKPRSQYTRNELARLCAYVPQTRSVPMMSVFQMALHGRFPYLHYPRRYQPEDRHKTEDVLRRLGLEPVKTRLLAEISGGQRQKAYLAMSLVQDTPYLFLDEPCTYLDLPFQLELLKTLVQLTRQNRGIVMIGHDLIQALEYADEIVLVDSQKIRFAGRPEALLESGWIEKIFGFQVVPAKVQGHRKYVIL